MKVWEAKLVPVSFSLSTLLFLFAAFKPLAVGEPLNAAFLSIGVISLVVAIATWRKSGHPPGSPGA